MLYVIKKTTDDKVVLISNYTQTIDLFEQMCRLRGYKFVRLDGSLSTKKRQKLVDELNAPNVFFISKEGIISGLISI